MENIISKTADADPIGLAIKTALAIRQQRAMQALQQAQQQSLQTQTQLAPGKAQALEGLQQAQTGLAEAKLKDPLLGASLTGVGGEVQGVQAIIRKYGVDSPQAKMVIKAYNDKLKLQESRANYFGANYHLKNLPQTTKNQIISNWQQNNADRQQQGASPLTFQDYFESSVKPTMQTNQRVSDIPESSSHEPVTNSPEVPLNEIGKPHSVDAAPTITQDAQTPFPNSRHITPEEAKLGTANRIDYARQAQETRQVIQKSATDSNTRNLALQLNALNKDLNTVDPNIFLPYTGIAGTARLLKDKARTLIGERVPQYEKFHSFTHKQIPILVDQIRKAYGTSITPQLFNILKDVANPVRWDSSPSVALNDWHELKRLMNQQANIYETGLRGPIHAITPQQDKQISGFSEKQIENMSKKLGMSVDEAKKILSSRGL